MTQVVRCINTTDGKERWIGRVSGFVTSLSMTPEASTVIAGTETGNIAAFDQKGNLSWNYAVNPEDRQASGITCSAVSDNGALIAAGTADGRILFLNSRGDLSDSYAGKEYIRHIAVSADGSTIVATTDNTILAFSRDSLSTPVTGISQTPLQPTPVARSSLTPGGTQAPASIPSPGATHSEVLPEVPATRSIPATTQSPDSFIIFSQYARNSISWLETMSGEYDDSKNTWYGALRTKVNSRSPLFPEQYFDEVSLFVHSLKS
jgi:outer membrane protein assembly factor BamB